MGKLPISISFRSRKKQHNNNIEIKTRVYGKRQTSDSRLRFLKINKYTKIVQNNHHVYRLQEATFLHYKILLKSAQKFTAKYIGILKTQLHVSQLLISEINCHLGPVQTSCFCRAELNSGIKFDKSTAEARRLNQTFELSSALN